VKRLRPNLAFLKPRNPQDLAALATLCVLLLGLGAAGLKGVESLFSEDPWNVRADHVCLEAGNRYLNAEGDREQQLSQRVDVSREALDYLRAIAQSVPLESTLEFQSMLGTKETILHLLERELRQTEAGEPTAAADSRIQGILVGAYGPEAERLGLFVCGQGTGRQ
jgi:hypothetical protein